MSIPNSLHPLFVGILAGLGAPLSPATIDQALVDQYVADLKAMDWTFEHSSDHGVWSRGRYELERLRRVQRELDPTGAIWREHAHPDYAVLL